MSGLFLSRRSILCAAASLPLVATADGAQAQTNATLKGATVGQAPGFVRFRVGDYVLTMLSDGQLSLPARTLGANVPEATLRSYLKSVRLGSETQRAHLNLTLIDTGERVILVDAGAGPSFADAAGRIDESLKAAGYAPADIDLIVITHGHPDHVWGLLDDAGEQPRFAHAEYAINAAEWQFWTDETLADRLPEAQKAMARGARKSLTAVSGRTKRVQPADEVAPGISLFDAPGHTPGHSGVMVESSDQRLLIVGDALTHPYISFEQPEWYFGFDMDGAQAAVSRKRILDMAASEDLRLALYHAPFPGVGRVGRLGAAYRFIPDSWDWTI